MLKWHHDIAASKFKSELGADEVMSEFIGIHAKMYNIEIYKTDIYNIIRSHIKMRGVQHSIMKYITYSNFTDCVQDKKPCSTA